MNKVKIVLIPTISFPISKISIYIPLGLLAIKAYIGDEANVKIVDPSVMIKENILPKDLTFYSSFTKYLVGLSADLYAFSTTIGSYLQTIRMAEELKKALPTALVALGGPQASACDMETLKCCGVDFVIRGEGEIPLLNLARTLRDGGDLSCVPSLTLPTGRTSCAERIDDLDSLPIPKYSEYSKWYKDYLIGKPEYDILSYVPIDSGRGCLGRCKFCYSPSMWNRKCRLKSAKRLFSEVKYLFDEFGINKVFFTEDNFTLVKKRVKELCDLLIEWGSKVQWTCFSRIDTIDSMILRFMKDAGCRQIYYGVESGSEKILKMLGKNYTNAEAAKVIRESIDCGIDVTASYIIGFAEEDDIDLMKTINAYADSIIAGAVSKLHLIGVEYGTEYYFDIEDKMELRPSLSQSVLEKEYLIDKESYDRISKNKKLFSYFYVVSNGLFTQNWVKKFRLEYNYGIFSSLIETIRKKLDDGFLLRHLKMMISNSNLMESTEELLSQVNFFSKTLSALLFAEGKTELSIIANNEYSQWLLGNRKTKSISKTLIMETKKDKI